MISPDAILFIFLLIFFSTLCIGLGIFFLQRTGRSDTVLHNENQDSPENASETAASIVEKVLAKKGLLIESWGKTNRLRDQLKILKIATNEKKADRSSQ